MKIEGDAIFTRIVNKQFEILGEKTRFSDIPDDGVVQNGKKKDYWYNVYKFTEEQESTWKQWALDELREVCSDDVEALEVLREIELLYGFVLRYTKKGELF